MGPSRTPWLTFYAWIVIALTVVFAAIWSLLSNRKDDR